MWIAGIVIAYLRGFEPGSTEYLSFGGSFQVVMTLLLLAALFCFYNQFLRLK
ncbi:FIG00554052: hypothetical protein [Cronobacter universalis NCTC 9529]|nr:FIG00554052: hypothetical protein [Cronobacter universalis NCTC 9529]